MLSIRLSDEITHRLNMLAKKTGRTKSYYVREALIEHLDNLEDLYLSVERMEEPKEEWSWKEMGGDFALED